MNATIQSLSSTLKCACMVFAAVSFLTLAFTSHSMAQDVKVIAAEATGVDITPIINGDTTSTGEFVDRIYELERNAFYFVSAPLDKDGSTLHLRAQDGDGTPPLLLPLQSEGGSWPDFIRQRGDLILEGIWFDSQNGDNRNAGRPIRLLADSARAVIKGNYFENARGAALVVLGNNQKWYVTDNVFARMGQRATPGGNGRALDVRDARPVDTLIFQNNTIYMVMDRVIRTQGGSIHHFKFDHNTVFNHEGEHGNLQLGTVTGDAIVTNNLFLDAQWKGAHPNIAEQTQKENDSHYMVTLDTLTAELNVQISHNNAAWSQLVYDFWSANSSVTSKPPLLIESLEGKMGTEAFNAAFTEEEFVELADVPALADYADYMNALFADPRPDPFPQWQETDLIGAPFIDASYSTSSASYTAAMDGFPLGDLNFFPDRKAAWEAAGGGATSNETGFTSLPSEFSLKSAYPNPFNPATTLSYELSRVSNVRYSVYSILGQEVFSRDLGMMQPGRHSATFDAAGLPSGVYIVRMQAGADVRSLQVTLLK